MTHSEAAAQKISSDAERARREAIELAENCHIVKTLRVLLREYAELTAIQCGEDVPWGRVATRRLQRAESRSTGPARHREKAVSNALRIARLYCKVNVREGRPVPALVAMIILSREITNLETMPKIRAFRAGQKNGGKK